MEEARCELQDNDWYMTMEELDAFIAVLYIRGAIGAHNLDLDSLWSIKWGNPIIKATMSRNRFREIMKYLRFDHKSSRRQRLNEDKFAMISDICYEFIANAQACYIPGPYITIDEQLFPSKCRCRFTQFIRSKPDKYGQKFWMAVDKDANYIINAFPYLGKDDHKPNGERLGDWVVKKLMEPYINKGRNVTCDNFFTSLLLAEYLKSKNTSVVGTVNRVRREIP
ncbi:PiggyBac transposable element-derived protein 4 [Eumeta japonica]|uniref:PiggyBac transposable element-derived protein 4 n=1 Tax=Eumeta variegata TaxID=151549 RepID=A0A4C1SQG0_EUMVA|nr:PiggyBac transposable element-derived protein 4 [Eumeta japonica]